MRLTMATAPADAVPPAALPAVLPGAEPFGHDGGDIGVLLCHGFTGTPQSLRPWAEHLAAEGLTVRLPRLPGHGTRWQDLNRTRWQDWYAADDRAFRELRDRCSTVVVAGLSMGGTLALRLAEEHGGDVDGIVLVNPSVTSADPRLRAVPVLKQFVPSLRAIGNDIKRPDRTELAYTRTPLRAVDSLRALWRLVAADLAKVTQPMLMYLSAVDHVVGRESALLLLGRVSSTDVTSRTLGNSFHVATLDNDAGEIFTGSVEFARRVATRTAG